MAVTIFVVRANITKEKEATFNKWYNEEHVPQLLRYNGAVSARRYRKILGNDKYEYMAVYEFASEEIFQRFQESPSGRLVLACIEPHCVPTDWQVVEMEALPGGTVGDFMTTAVLTVDPTTPVRRLDADRGQ